MKEKVLPELDDEFAKSLGGEFETLDAVKAEARKQLEAQREMMHRRGLEEQVLDAVLAMHEFSVPDAMVMRHIAHHPPIGSPPCRESFV